MWKTWYDLLLRVIGLEELLIDFRELEGEHSGLNMAEAVWETVTRFGIENRVSCEIYLVLA